MIKIIKKIFWFPFNSKNRINDLQSQIRLSEWQSFSDFIKSESLFLDVGCGAGHNLSLAQELKNCKVHGIDPNPGDHGVGRYNFDKESSLEIIQGFAENLPFKNNIYDIVFCSHVLEHVNDERKSLSEINRVLKEDGIAIIGMPTATMAIINLFSSYLFTTHRNILFTIKSFGKNDFISRLKTVFVPASHSCPRASSIFYDINHYRVKKWKRLIEQEFEIIETIQPLLYPYPDYIQLFKMHKSKIGSSSVFFICKKTK
jgi:ubiquinone/menaquinone biosynthesis C-methylase UbiE